MNDLHTIITERLQELPERVETYLKDISWADEIAMLISKHSLNPEVAQDLQDEFVLYVLATQSAEEFAQSVQTRVPDLPKAISQMITSELIALVPQDIQELNSRILTVDEGEAVTESKQQTEAVPNNLPTDIPPQKEAAESAQTESVGGVDIIPEETEQEDDTTLGKNSLIQSIEDPEKTRPTETQSQFNPVRSKLGNNQEAQRPASSPQYGEGDPYREPIS